MLRSFGWIVSFFVGVGLAIAGVMYHFNLFPSLEIRAAKAGKLEGKLIVQWLEPDKFLFVPDSAAPLKFTRASGEVVQPMRLVTDGGSVPRPMWVSRSYSPWGFAPAFILHDWLFEMKRCKIAGNPAADYKVAALIMAEVIKTMAAAGVAQVDDLTLVSMHAAVTSTYAKDYWDNGRCESGVVAAAPAPMARSAPAPAPGSAPSSAPSSAPAPSAGASAPMVRVPATTARKVLEAKPPLMQYEIKF